MTSLAEPCLSSPAASPEQFDVFVGGDTHRDSHHLEMVDRRGVVLTTLEVSNSSAGNAQVLAWLTEHLPEHLTGPAGDRALIGLEGTRSYGIGLARAVRAAGLRVVEVERPSRTDRRGRGKSDPIDAHHAALAVLRLALHTPDRLPAPRADGDREALRILLVARQEMTTTRTRQGNQLHALLLTGDDTDRDLGRGSFSTTTLTLLTRRRGSRTDTREQTIRRQETARLARALLDATAALKANLAQLATIVDDLSADLDTNLINRPGIGPVSAAQALVSFSHPGRFRNDAAFASLAGVSPLPASSGRTRRHRLNRSGDRALNRALHDIAKTRMRCDPRTHAYVERRRAEGLSDREIRRCLKRYIARELYRALTPNNPPTPLDNT